jgi:hypothetical protein
MRTSQEDLELAKSLLEEVRAKGLRLKGEPDLVRRERLTEQLIAGDCVLVMKELDDAAAAPDSPETMLASSSIDASKALAGADDYFERLGFPRTG